MVECNICKERIEDIVYEATAAESITSMCVNADKPTHVYYCKYCTHVQTLEYGSESDYYDNSYNILIDNEEEDQIYEVKNGEPVFRTEHQLKTLMGKVNLKNGMNVLDYGCGKSSTISKLAKSVGINAHAFDVSTNYLPFWKKFLKDENWATYQTPNAWNGKFDLITSFFSLEHITNLNPVIDNIKNLLDTNGTFYAIVPNCLTNIADLIVIDHPNHFTKGSIIRLFYEHGLVVDSIDDQVHRGAFVVTAKHRQSDESLLQEGGPIRHEIKEISQFWSEASRNIQNFESKNRSKLVAIYGAGFYGAFIANNLINKDNLKVFVDKNPFLHDSSLLNKKIIAPENLPNDIETLYVGLNPAHARNIIQNVAELNKPSMNLFFL